MSEHSPIPGLMLVTDRLRAARPIVEVVQQAVAGGIEAVQIREKDLPDDELTVLAKAIRDVVTTNVKVLINGSPFIACELHLGLHLPEKVPFPDAVRSNLASGALVGRSVHSAEAALASRGFDYLIAGHVFETGSKAGLPVLGLDGLSEIVGVAPCPVLAIGGITPGKVGAVLEAGASGVAVMSGICSHPDPQAAARAYVQALNGVSMTPSTKLKNATIDVQVNGRPTQLLAGMTVADFLEQKGLHPNMVVVEHNGHILKRGQFTGVLINAGDVLEVVHFVGGG